MDEKQNTSQVLNQETKINWDTYFPDHVIRYLPGGINERVYEEKYNTEQKLDVYFTVNGQKDFETNKSCTAINVTSLNAFFADFDFKDSTTKVFVPEAKEEFRNVVIPKIKEKTPPTIIIETGAGFHMYWCLDEPIFKEDIENELDWYAKKIQWENIEKYIVDNYFKDIADTAAKDIARIMRYPNTIYWKDKTGSKRITTIHYNPSATYSLSQAEELFEYEEIIKDTTAPIYKEVKKRDDDFWSEVDSKYPITERDYFKKLYSGSPDSLPPDESRNHALLVTASLAAIDGSIPQEEFMRHIIATGWHGMTAERSGHHEIETTINSAYKNKYKYHKDALVIFNQTKEDENKILKAISSVNKTNREVYKVRFDNFHNDFIQLYPNLIKIDDDEDNVYFYKDGVYTHFSERRLEDLVIREINNTEIYSGFRTVSHMKSKVRWIIAEIPTKNETEKDGTIINVKNGLLNINTMELKPHTPEYISFSQVQTEYQPNATCPTWDKVISEWMAGDEEEEKKELLQRFSGYTLTEHCAAQKALILLGSGGNGKSTFVHIINSIIGKKSTSNLSLEFMLEKFGTIGILGKQLNITEEISDKKIPNSETFKKIISGERIQVDVKNRPQIAFNPKVKLILAVNEMPRIEDPTDATNRRLLVVCFNNSFIGKEDTALKSSGSKMGVLHEELPGILNWMIQGLKKISNENYKFSSTYEHNEVMKHFREENNPIDRFMAECYETVDDPLDALESPKIEMRDMWEVYKDYMEQTSGNKYNAYAKSYKGFCSSMKMIEKRDKKFLIIEDPQKRKPMVITGVTFVGYDRKVMRDKNNGFKF